LLLFYPYHLFYLFSYFLFSCPFPFTLSHFLLPFLTFLYHYSIYCRARFTVLTFSSLSFLFVVVFLICLCLLSFRSLFVSLYFSSPAYFCFIFSPFQPFIPIFFVFCFLLELLSFCTFAFNRTFLQWA
jgi:hypothetical protein